MVTTDWYEEECGQFRRGVNKSLMTYEAVGGLEGDRSGLAREEYMYRSECQGKGRRCEREHVFGMQWGNNVCSGVGQDNIKGTMDFKSLLLVVQEIIEMEDEAQREIYDK